MANIASLKGDYLLCDEMLDAFKNNNHSYCAPATDFALLLGLDRIHDRYGSLRELKNRYASWWSSNPYGPGFNVTFNGNLRESTRHLRNFRRTGERPVIYNFSDIIDVSDDALEVEYGEYPQFAVEIEMQKKLEELYNNDKGQISKKVFTFDGANPDAFDLPYHPEKLIVYIYEGRKYVRVKSREKGVISNGMEIFKNSEPPQYVWVEVSPIKWLVDKRENILISKYILLSGLRHKKIVRNGIPKWWTSSDYFLDTVFGQEIKTNKTKEKNEIDPKEEIVGVLNTIYDYRKYYSNNLDVDDEISKLLSEYNNKLDEYINKQTNNDMLVITKEEDEPKKLHQELINKLQKILFEVREYSEKVSNYYKMIQTLYECSNYLHDKKFDKAFFDNGFYKLFNDLNIDEMCRYIIAIRKILLFINQTKRDELIKELDDIINKNINRNIEYIKWFSLNDTEKPKTYSELEFEFRNDLHPFLIKLRTIIEKQDLVNEILNITKNKVHQLYRETKNERVNYMLNEIEKAKKIINEDGSSLDQEELTKMLKLDINLDDDLKLILERLEEVLLNVNKLSFAVLDKKRKKEQVSVYKVDEKVLKKKDRN